MDKADQVPCVNLALPPWSEEAGRRLRKIARLPGVKRLAVMPDAHLTEVGINGLAVGSQDMIYPALIGNDPGCGYSAVLFRTNGPCVDFTRMLSRKLDLNGLLSSIRAKVPIIKRHQPADKTQLPSPYLAHPALGKPFFREACSQLGTLGRGNHFLELLYDKGGYGFWMVVHSGSRAAGQQIMRTYLPDHIHDPLRDGIEVGSPEFHSFMHDLQWARDYASENRYQILLEAAHTLSGLFMKEFLVIDSDHNHLQKELIEGQELWIHRKSVTAVNKDDLYLLPANMARGSLVVKAIPKAELLNSIAHGCGRVCSRREARKKVQSNELLSQMENVVFHRSKASRWTDEAPTAYRPIRTILKAHKKDLKVQHCLKPLLNYKG